MSFAVNRSPPRRGCWLSLSLTLLVAAGCAASTASAPPARNPALSCPLCRLPAAALVTPTPRLLDEPAAIDTFRVPLADDP
jgi:hypothetical protein